MNDLLSPTEQAIAAIAIAVFAGLIAEHTVWIAIKKLHRRQAVRRAKADLDAKLAAKYLETMTEEQCDEMHTEKWNGD